jgi:nitronate monooxygenase
MNMTSRPEVRAQLPRIIQGGMGIGVSDWHLAKIVSSSGQLGVVSGTGIEIVVARRLQRGDEGGHVRRALSHFPIPEMAQKVIDKYYREGAAALSPNFKLVPAYTLYVNRDLYELAVCANFVEVWLAREGHDGIVGVNYLEKIQLGHLPALYGAMLAGVDYVLMGAGIPIQIPGCIDKLAMHEKASYKVVVEGSAADKVYSVHFDPATIIPDPTGPLKRPNFLPIISSVTLANVMATRATGPINGFIIEGAIAGGHNAPPRGKLRLDENNEPIYGERDNVDLKQIREIGLPFWLAGGYASPEKIAEAVATGATGVQLGSIFALSNDSGMLREFKRDIIRRAFHGDLEVRTDALASPSGFPFKVVTLENTLSVDINYKARPRICDVTRLRHPYVKEDGAIGFRCPAEPVADYLKKGGKIEETEGRKCLCNTLLAAIDLPQHQKYGYTEQPMITLGNDVSFLPSLIEDEHGEYTAAEAVAYLTGKRADVRLLTPV